MQAVDAVNNLVEATHLLELLGIDIEEILLDGRVWTDAHHDDSSLLILIARAVDSLEDIVGRLSYCNG